MNWSGRGNGFGLWVVKEREIGVIKNGRDFLLVVFLIFLLIFGDLFAWLYRGGREILGVKSIIGR